VKVVVNVPASAARGLELTARGRELTVREVALTASDTVLHRNQVGRSGLQLGASRGKSSVGWWKANNGGESSAPQCRKRHTYI